MNLRPIHFVSLILPALLASSAIAHAPHDPVKALSISPDYQNDQTLFIGQFPATNWRITEPLRSLDGAQTWTQRAKGMENLSGLTASSVSPAYADDGTVLYISSGEGVFLSTDRGDSWSAASGDLPDRNLIGSAIGINGAGDRVLFVRTGAGGLYRSDDLGTGWAESLPPSSGLTSFALSPDFGVDSTVVAGGSTGLIRSSSDGGLTWPNQTQLVDGTGVQTLLLVPGFSASGEVFAGTRAGGVFRSQDFALNFVAVDQDIPDESILAVAASPDYATDRTLFLTTTDHAVFQSVDGGDNWILNDVQVELSPQTTLHFRELALSDGFATDGTIFLAAFEGLYVSRDGGVNWSSLVTRPPSLVSGIDASPNIDTDHSLVASSYGGGLYRSSDRGGSWTVANTGISTQNAYDVAFVPDASIAPEVFAIQQETLLRSLDFGATWLASNFPSISPDVVIPTTLAVSPDFAARDFVAVGTRRDGMLGRLVELDIWRQLVPPPGAKISSIAFSSDFANDRILFAATNATVVARSRNGGRTWRSIGQGLPQVPGARWLATSPNYATEPLLLAGTPAGLWASTDDGKIWISLGGATRVADGIIEAVAISPDFASDRTILASVRGIGLYRSVDAGSNWAELDPSLLASGAQFSVLRFSPRYAADQTIFGIARSDIFRSADGGDTWEQVSIQTVRYEETRESVLFSGSWVSVDAIEASTTAFKRSDTPGDDATFVFHGTGVAWIGLSSPDLGTVEVYIDGALVATVDQSAEEVIHQVTHFDSGALPSGTHELRLVAISSGIIVDAIDVDR